MNWVWRCALAGCCAIGAVLISVSARGDLVTWLPDADGLWLTPANWSSTPALPGPNDDVTISPPGDRLITLSGSTQTIKSLVLNDRLTVSSATLVLGTTAQLNNNLTLVSGGTLRNGTISTTGAAAVIVSNGTLDDVSMAANSTIDVATLNGAQLDVNRGLTLNGLMSVGRVDGSGYGQVYFGDTGVASGAVSGNGSIILGGQGSNNIIYNYSDLGGADATLTLGPGITIHGKNGQIINRSASGTIINQGVIAADVSGGTLNIGTNGAFVNQGTISATNGAILTLSNAWSSTGTLSLGATSTLNLAGSFTQAGMGTFTRSGGTVNLTGTLTGNLALNAGTGSWNLISGGTVRNGTLSTTGGSVLVVSNGVLDGMSVSSNSTVDLTIVNGAQASIFNGLTLNGNVNQGKADGSAYGQLYFGSAGNSAGTLSGNGTITFGGNGNNAIYNYSDQISAAGTLTIGSGVTIHGKTGKIINNNASGTLLNQGLISADASGGTINLGGTGNFVNQGTLSAINGGTISINGPWSNTAGGTVTATDSTLVVGGGTGSWNNLGIITANNSIVNLNGIFTQAGLGNFTRTGGSVNLGGTLNGNLVLDATTGNWNLVSGGTVHNGSITTTGGAVVVVSNGVLDGASVTANSAVDLTGVNGAQLSIFNGLPLNGTLTVGKIDGSTYGQVYFGNSGYASGAISGAGSILLGASGNNNAVYNYSDQVGTSGTLTIGSGITIHGKSGQIINRTAAGTILNQGVIAADVSGGTFNIGGAGTFINQGSVSAATGTILNLNGNWSSASGASIAATGATLNLGSSTSQWSNAGTITATNSIVNLDGNFTQAGLGAFNRTGGTVNLYGVLSGNLALDANTGNWNLVSGGTVRNGTVSTTGGSVLVISSGTLDGGSVAVNSSVDVTGGNGAVLNVFGGLPLGGSVAVGKIDGSLYGQVHFGSVGRAAGDVSGNGTMVLGGYGNNNAIYNYSDQIGVAGTLTIGSGVTIRGKSGQIINNYPAGTIINKGTIAADVAGGTINFGNSTGVVLNQGAISTINGSTLALNGTWSNAVGATITATGSTLNLGSANGVWSNAGTITATSSTVNLDGNFTQTGLGNFNRTGGTVNLYGIVTGNLSLDANTGTWNAVSGGTLRNGILATTGGSSLIIASGNFDGASVAANAIVDLTGVNGAQLNVYGGLPLNGTMTVGKIDGSAYGQVHFGSSGNAAGTLLGNGTILFGGYGSNNAIYNYSDQVGSAGTLTIGSGITIHGKSGQIINNYAAGAIVNQGAISADVSAGAIGIGNATGTFLNQGAISAINGDTLSINGVWNNAAGGTIAATGSILNLGSSNYLWSNAGSITATNSTVNLNGTFSQAGLGTFNRTGGTINLVGTVTGNLALDANTGSWNMISGGTLRNGTLSTTGGTSLIVSSGNLDGASVSANSTIDLTGINGAQFNIFNGLALNGTLNVGKVDGSVYGQAYFGNTGTVAGNLTGTGTILFGDSSNDVLYNYSDQIGAAGTLTIGNGITIHGKSGRILNRTSASVINNQGAISADVAGGTIGVGNGTGTLVNQGTLSAVNGGTLTISAAWTNTGTLTENASTLNLGGSMTTAGLGLAGFSRTGGVVNISGALNNTGTTLTLDAARGSWGLTNSGSITGGTVALSGGSRLLVTSGALSNVIVNGDMDVSSTGVSFNALTLNGIARINGGFNPIGTQTLAGTPTLMFQGNGSVGIGAGTTLTLPAVVATRGGSGTFNGGGTLINQGLISADTASTTITLSPTNLTNTTGGIIEAAGGNLTIGATNFTNNGILRATAGTLSINSGVALNNTPSSSVIINGGTISFGSAATSPSLDLSVGTLAGSGAFSTPTFNWTGGTMSGSGKTVVASGAALNISGTGAKTLSRSIDNSGTTAWTDGQILTSSGTFNNLAGGVFTVTAANSFFNSGGSNLFNNTGAFAKNSSSITIFGIPFTNQAAGIVNVNDGTLVLSGGGTNFGTINIAAGATARFGGNFTHAAGSTLSGAGNIDFNTTTVSLDGNLIIDGELSFNSASATVKAGATVTKLSLTGSSATVAAGGVLSVGAGGVNFGGATNNTVTLQPSATTPGKLMLIGNVNFTGSDGTAALNTADFVAGQTPGMIDLTGATRTFSINDGNAAIDLALSARIANGSIIKSGTGTMRLDSPNPFTGGTTISAGTLVALDPAALGTGNVTIGDATLSLKSDLASPVTFPNNVTVTGDATVNVDRISVGTTGVERLGVTSIGTTRLTTTGANRTLELAGMNLAGNPTLNIINPLTINGPITQGSAGMGITKSTGLAKLTIGGSTSNTFTGITRINAGPVELNKPANVVAVGGDLQVFGGSVKLLADGQIADTGAVTLANAGTLLDFAGHSDTFGAMSITGNASATVGVTGVPSSLGSAVLRATSLVISTGGKLDLANNRMIVDYTGATPITSIRSMIASAYANGAWTGSGLVSSSAAGSNRTLGYAEASDAVAPNGGMFANQNVDGTAVLIRYTLSGDANLDGSVDFNDLVKLAQNYNIADGSRTWFGGDFNYDGNTDFNDLVKLAQNYNSALPGAPIPGATAAFEADLATAFASVPEPATPALLALVCLAFLTSRLNRRPRSARFNG